MSRTVLVAFTCAVWTLGCLPVPTAVRGSDVSRGNRLRDGMSMVQVESIVGPHQIEKVKKFTGKTEACRSYIYDEEFLSVQLLQVYFLNSKLVSSSDGHKSTWII
jgi:hypothetical protein